ncbi:MAG: F0F1 ATP synthase subunit B [Ruminococcus sp.]|nr:F0F1 ATP synthase subunit B [Oscillospiraceae bacterium]
MEIFSSGAILASVMKAADDAGIELADADSAEAETAAATTGESEQSILTVNVWNIIWSVVNILLLVILLKIFLFKPVNKMMEERTASIQNDIDSAKKAREEAEELKAQYAGTIQQAKDEAKQILAKAHEQAASEKQDIIRQSQDEADRIVETANKNIENERKRSMQQAQAQIADLAIAAATKIIGENMDDAKNRKLVDEFLSQEGANEQ